MEVLCVKYMPLNLEFSRQRNDDEPVRFDDVPVQSSSIMVDALSILSQFRRSAGWLYPMRPVTATDYERGRGQLILFGKNRVTFSDFKPPYVLEFFPRFGIKTYILSVYTGELDEGVVSGWVNVLGGGWYVNYFPEEYLLRSRFGGAGGPVYDFQTLVVDAFVLADAVFFKKADLTYEEWRPYRAGGGSISAAEYEVARSAAGAIVLS